MSATLMRTAFVLLLAGVCASATAQEPGPYARIMIPLTPQGPVHGAGGSLWFVETWLSYSGARPTTVIPRVTGCLATCLDDLIDILVPYPDPQAFASWYRGESGLLVSVPSVHAREIHINSRVRDLSHAEVGGGTEVPVVSENAFTSAPVRLTSVAISPSSRTALRIYALPEVAEPQVEIRYFRMPRPPYDGGNLLKADRVNLTRYASVGKFLLYPSFATVSNLESMPEFASTDTLFIDIVPLTGGLRIWAMASTTSNVTQQVTIVSPHP